MPVYLAIDAGTTAIKLLLADGQGQTRFRSQRPVTVLCGQDGSAEIDTAGFWASICSLCREAASVVPEDWAALAEICITGQGDGLWAVDHQGHDLPRAICWQDLRADVVCGDPRMEELHCRHHSNGLWSGTRAAILAWLKQNHPARYRQIHLPLQCVSWLNYRLTGISATDPSCCGDAFDIFSEQHVPEIYQQLGIAEQVPLLPPVLPADAVIGTVTADAAAQTGLPAGTPVRNGCVDATAVTIGSGIPEAGTAQICIGTTLLVMHVSRQKPDFPLPDGAYADALPLAADRYRMTLAAASGACAIDHEKEKLFPDLTYEALYDRLQTVPIGSSGLTYLPYLHGERAPFRCARAAAGYHHETLQHTDLHRMRAAVEGVLFAARHCADALGVPLNRVELSGGASRSPVLCAMAADVFGLPVEVGSSAQAGTAGCLTLMGIPVNADASPKTVYTPDPAHHAAYGEAYERYLQACRTMRAVWDAEAGKESLWISN